MKIPASKQESENAIEAATKAKEALALAADSLKDLIAHLDENFLAINEIKSGFLSREVTKINSSMWNLNMVLHKMRDNEERIIHLERDAEG